jgi:4-amino-4-deoxy-L-arabinose transferase-like glycosyltransferase
MEKNKRSLYLSLKKRLKPANSFLALAGLFLLSLFLRSLFLGAKCFWADEMWLLALAEHDLLYIRDYIAITEINPPLFYWMMKGWIRLVGTNEAAVRVIPMIFGSLTVLLFYWFLSSFTTRKRAFCASLLLAISPFHILFSQLAKVYTVMGFVLILSFYLFAKTFKEPKNLFLWILLALTNSALLYLHNFGWIVIAIEGITFLFFHRKAWVQWILSNAITIAIFIPWLPYFWGQYLQAVTINKGGLNSQITRVGYTFFTFVLGESINPFTYIISIPAILLFLILFSLGLFTIAKERSFPTAFILTGIAVPLGINFITPFSWPQNFIPFLPLFLYTIAAGVDSLKRRARKTAIILIIFFTSVSLYFWYQGNPSQLHDIAKNLPYQQITAQIASDPSAEIIITTEQREFIGAEKIFSSFDWYYHGSLPVISWYTIPQKKALSEIQKVFRTKKRVWLLLQYNAGIETNDFIKEYLTKHTTCIKRYFFLHNERIIQGRILKNLPRYYYFFELYLFERKSDL